MYENSPAEYGLNSYLWKLLQANLGWSKTSYNGAVPIIPISQQPELKQSGKPFIVYGVAQHPAEHLYALKRDSVSYTIYADNSTEANKIVNLISDVFDRQDEAAADVNTWLGVEQAGRNKSRNLSFASIRTVMVEKATPSEEEGGLVSALVMLEVRYTNTSFTAQTSGFTYQP